MGNYIGRDVPYGQFDTQALTPNSVLTTFNLTYKVSTAASILVIRAGQTLQPSVDYSLASGGTQIVFTVAPTTGTVVFIIYLGRELATPSSVPSFVVLAAAGSTTTNATVTTSLFHYVTGADGTKGVRVEPTLFSGGGTMIIANQSTSALRVYPPTGLAFYNKATNASVTVAAAAVLNVHKIGSAYMAVTEAAA